MDQWVLDIEIVLVVKDGDLLVLICVRSPAAAPTGILIFLHVGVCIAILGHSIGSSWRDGDSVKRDLLGVEIVG